jgi:preprotein translocase subunit SecD
MRHAPENRCGNQLERNGPLRIRPWQALIGIVLLALAAGWVVAPGQALDPRGWKRNIAVREGLDLQGGLQVLMEARPPAGRTVDAQVLEGTKGTIERRVNGLGVSEPIVQTRGDNQIIVELPGIQNPEQAVEVLRETAQLEIVSTGATPLQVGQTITTSLGGPEAARGAGAGATPPAGEGATAPPTPAGPVYETIVEGRDVEDAFPTVDDLSRPAVGFRLKGDAPGKFYQFTSSNTGRFLSVVVDKQVISTAEVRAPISSQGIIQGMSQEEVNALVLQLKSGALEVPLEVVQSRTIGPTLGQDSIRKSIEAGVIGLGVVALFMILYYRLPGLLAVVALLLYALFTFALFKLLGVVLTLAGIAGFVLSIGMAVDANVLIFARLKEELRLGRRLSGAIEAGFDHAWPSIRDSNISTMITCAILFWFGRFVGASIIQGFALTLFLGVVVSMFTAVTVSRTLLRLMVDAGVARHPRWFGTDRAAPAPAAGD